jgi:anaerobic magnesium-protoporphyrin IX monomethyl ester cyclase
MKVVLLNPPVPGAAFTNRDLMGGMGISAGFGVGLGPRFVALLKYEGIRLPVLALAYPAAILQKHHDVVVLDLSRRDPGDAGVLDAVVREKPDWVIAASSFAYLGAELRFLQKVREATGASRMLVGYAATHFAEEILQRGLGEAVAKGDPEGAAKHLAEGTLRPGVEGVLMKGALGNMIPAGEAYIADLDALPVPAWDKHRVDDYAYFPLLKHKPFLTSLSSRGCPYACGFCPYPIGQGEKFRARSAESVVAEMQFLVERHGVKSLLFRDPTFSLDMKRVKKICRLLIERGVKLEWGIETRLDRMDTEMIELLGQAGCRSAEMGIDPVEEHTREASNRKGIAPEKAAALIGAMEQNGIATAGLFVIGLPEQSVNEMERTLDWIQTLDLSYMNYEVATPFPGTPLYAEAVAKQWTEPLKLEDLLTGDPKLGFNGVIDLDAMRTMQDRALRRFYVRPRKVAREIFNKDFLVNAQFMASCGLKFLRTGARP